MKNLLLILFVGVVAIGCGDTKSFNGKKVVLSANREAPAGWTTFEMYEDSTFQLTSSGFLGKDIYQGLYFFESGLTYLLYWDTISNFVGQHLHICGSSLLNDKGQLIGEITENNLSSIYGNHCYFDCSGISHETLIQLFYLERFIELPAMVVGDRGIPSKHMDATKEFSKQITVAEANILHEHPNSFIRALAFKKLWLEGDSTVYEKLVDSFTDSLIVYKHHGCLIEEFEISDYYLSIIGYGNPRFDTLSFFTKKQMSNIDSLAEVHNSIFGTSGSPHPYPF